MFTKEYTKEYSELFTNYKKILETSKFYINNDLSDNKNMIIEVKEKENKKINNSICDAFGYLKNYQNEFEVTIISCQNFLIVILFSGEFKENKFFGVPSRILDKESSNSIEIFVANLDLFYKVNKYYGIIDYTIFYNDGV